MPKHNFFGQVLVGLLVLFLLIGSIQLFGVGQSIKQIEIDPENQTSLPKVPKSTLENNENILADSKLLVNNINARPMFSADRLPFVPPEEDPENNPENPDNIVINEINAKLTGVVLTPEQSYAMILDSTTNQRETYKVGMPLEGEQGGWTLTSIQSRKVVFTSDDEKTAELELEVFGGTKAKTNRNNKNGKGKNSKANPTSRQDKKKNADDIRRKIAERRAQMRAEAAKKRQ